MSERDCERERDGRREQAGQLVRGGTSSIGSRSPFSCQLAAGRSVYFVWPLVSGTANRQAGCKHHVLLTPAARIVARAETSGQHVAETASGGVEEWSVSAPAGRIGPSDCQITENKL